jgi:hypothetical protein
MDAGGWQGIIRGKESESGDSRGLIKDVEHRCEWDRRFGGGKVIGASCTILRPSGVGSGHSGGRGLRSMALSQAGREGGWKRSVVDGFGSIPGGGESFPS